MRRRPTAAPRHAVPALSSGASGDGRLGPETAPTPLQRGSRCGGPGDRGDVVSLADRSEQAGRTGRMVAAAILPRRTGRAALVARIERAARSADGAAGSAFAADHQPRHAQTERQQTENDQVDQEAHHRGGAVVPSPPAARIIGDLGRACQSILTQRDASRHAVKCLTEFKVSRAARCAFCLLQKHRRVRDEWHTPWRRGPRRKPAGSP